MMWIKGHRCYADTDLPDFHVSEIDNIQASGPELRKCEKILGKKVPGKEWVFVGDEAKTIFANWENVK